MRSTYKYIQVSSGSLRLSGNAFQTDGLAASSTPKLEKIHAVYLSNKS